MDLNTICIPAIAGVPYWTRERFPFYVRDNFTYPLGVPFVLLDTLEYDLRVWPA